MGRGREKHRENTGSVFCGHSWLAWCRVKATCAEYGQEHLLRKTRTPNLCLGFQALVLLAGSAVRGAEEEGTGFSDVVRSEGFHRIGS